MPFKLRFIGNLLVSPLFLSLLLAVASEILECGGATSLGRIVLFFAIAWLWLWSMPLFVNRVGRMIESKYPPVAVETMESADAIVILGGGVLPVLPPRLYPDVNSAGNRVLHAARLYKAGKAKWIISSGWSGTEAAEHTSPAPNPTCTILKELGIPEEVVLTEDQSLFTRENAQFTKRLLDDHGIEKILLVTSALHMPRAMAEFRPVCSEVIPAPTDFGAAGILSPALVNLMSDSIALDYGSKIYHELIGSVIRQFRS